MRTLILACLVVFTSKVTSAQSILLNYDSSGNRIERRESNPLPVQLSSFDISAAENSVLLVWTTTSEIYFSHFVIERSGDGINWLPLGELVSDGDGDQTSYYQFQDDNPLNGLSYYRLKMVDNNLTFTYSPIANIYTEGGTLLYPNPVEDILQVRNPASFVRFEVFGNDGRFLLDGNDEHMDGINLSHLTPGIYWIVLHRGDASRILKKIVKQ